MILHFNVSLTESITFFTKCLLVANKKAKAQLKICVRGNKNSNCLSGVLLICKTNCGHKRRKWAFILQYIMWWSTAINKKKMT